MSRTVLLCISLGFLVAVTAGRFQNRARSSREQHQHQLQGPSNQNGLAAFPFPTVKPVDPGFPGKAGNQVPSGRVADCQPRINCSLMGDRLPRDHGEIIDWNCHCDDLCQSYDDCCPDYVRNPQSTLEIIHLQPEVVGCQPIGIEFVDGEDGHERLIKKDFNFRIVDRCPSDYNDVFISDKCRLGSTASNTDEFYRFPVNGKTSKVLYRNYYCAICNGDPKVLFWQSRREVCPDEEAWQDTSDADVRNRSVGELMKDKVHCDIRYHFPRGYRPRPCKKVVRKCSEDWTDQKIARQCQDRSQVNNYTYLALSDSSYTTYRNKHCVVCNNINESRTVCVDPKTGVTSSPPYDAPPYSILIDFNSRTLLVEDDRSVYVTSVVMRECDLGSIYDPFAEVCRLVFCRKGYTATNDGCSPTRHSGGRPSNRTDLPDVGSILGCDTIRLNETEYRIFDNQSAYVYDMSVLLGPDKYRVVSSQLVICPTFSGRTYNETVYTLRMFTFDPVQSLLSYVGVVISLMSIVLLFAVYMMFPSLRNTPGKCVICLIACLFLGQLAFLFVSVRAYLCFYRAIVMHFAYLAAFFWMNIMAFDICRAFMSTTSTTLTDGSSSRRFLLFSLYAWSTPAAIVGVSTTMDVLRLDQGVRPRYGEHFCWFADQTAFIIFFVVPVGVILIVNAVFFGVAIYSICKAARVAEAAVPGSNKYQLVVYIKLSLIMGLTWVVGFVAALTEWAVLWYVFICLNAFQGVLLCVVFVCTKKVLGLLHKKWTGQSTTSTTAAHQTDNRKCHALTNDKLTSGQKDKSKVISKETCM